MCVCPYTFVSVSALVFVCLNVYPCFCIVSLCVCVCVCVCVSVCLSVFVLRSTTEFSSVSLQHSPITWLFYPCLPLSSKSDEENNHIKGASNTLCGASHHQRITLKGPQTLSVEPHTTK